MLKTTVKIILTFFLIILVAVATGLTTYFITVKMMSENTADSTNVREVQNSTTEALRQRSVQAPTPETPVSIKYIVQLEGSSLGIYLSHNGTREFLYHETICPENLSADDIQLLHKGVTFDSMAELTEFIENFTS